MNDFKQFLSLEESKLDWKIVLFLILLAYAFNIAVRYIYISYAGDMPQFQWNGHLMINNNDGYTWAEGARDILAGFHQQNDLSRVDTPASQLIAFFARFLPFVSFDVLLEYLPGFLGALVVVPIVLIGRTLGSAWVGFLASLLGGMAWSYYHRTMFGYLDTDMLVIVLPTFAVWATMHAFKYKNITFFIIASLIEIFMIRWHGGLFNVANGIFIMSVIYVALFDREKNSALYLSFLIAPLLPFSLIYKIVTLIVIFVAFIGIKFETKKIWYIIGAIVGVYIVIVGFPWIKNVLLSGYFTRDIVNSDDGLKYFSVVNTVREAGHISYDTLVHRISGSWIGIAVGLMGYLLLLIRYPLMMISLPMVVLGFFAIRGGLRFTIFTVPFMAIGDAYLAYLIGKIGYRLFINDKVAKISTYIISFLIMVGFIYPNYKHIYRYLVPTVFTKKEVKVLDKLKHIASREDYVLTWWDYGYPIRYYADVKTLVDGGKHSGDVNYPVSFALTRDLISSRNMAILDVYQTEYDFKRHQDKNDYIKEMMKRYGLKDPDDLIYMLSTNIKLPKTKENVYYFLPLRMMNIFPTVAIFGTIDLKSGKRINHFFTQTNGAKKRGNTLYLSNGIKVDLSKSNLIIGRKIVPIKRFSVVAYDKSGKIHTTIQKAHPQGLNIIFMKSYNKWLIMDDFFFDSAYIQLFVFENTKGLFEPIILTPYAKVFRVKR